MSDFTLLPQSFNLQDGAEAEKPFCPLSGQCLGKSAESPVVEPKATNGHWVVVGIEPRTLLLYPWRIYLNLVRISSILACGADSRPPVD